MGKVLVIILILSINFLTSPVLASGNRVPIEDTTIRTLLLDSLEIGGKYSMKITAYTCWTTAHTYLEITRDCDGYLGFYKTQSGRRSSIALPDSGSTRLTNGQLEGLKNLERNLYMPVKAVDHCGITINYRITVGDKTKNFRDTGCRSIAPSFIMSEIFRSNNEEELNTPILDRHTNIY